MTRYLYIVRHARAEDTGIFAGDFERELVPSGIIDAARMGKFLKNLSIKPDIISSSSAPRAFQTAKIMAEQLCFDTENIYSSRTLYDEGPKAYLAAIGALPPDCQSAMIVGHNPDVSFFAEYITGDYIGSMSKGAVVVVVFDDLNWTEVSARTGQLKNIFKPKELEFR